jgi:methyl-accepting chemotaxis protein
VRRDSSGFLSWSSLSLRGKILSVTSVSVALVSLILVSAFFLQLRGLLTEGLRRRGTAVALGLSNNLAFSTFSKDKVGLQAAANSSLRDIPDVGYVVIRSLSGETLAKSVAQDVTVGGDFVAALPSPTVAEGVRVDDRMVNIGSKMMLDVIAPIIFEERVEAGSDANAFDPTLDLGAAPEPARDNSAKIGKTRRVGLIQLGFRMDSLQAQISTVTWRSVALGLVVFVFCLGAAWMLARLLSVPIERLSQVAGGIAQGNLQHKIENTSKDEIGALARSFETMTGVLRSMIADLALASQDIEREANNMLTTSHQQSAMTSQQATGLNETSATVKEIAQTSTLATEQADAVIKITQKAEEFAREGQDVIQQTIQGMEKLDEQVRAIAITITDLTERAVQIGDIIATVKDVAERSDMLALNASIEAAKAGEHGRGFSVVATEMRSLAEQSKLAAGQVRQILGEVQKVTRAAVSATEEGSRRAQTTVGLAQTAGETIVKLADVCRESSLSARQIAGNTRQQTAGVEQIVQALTEVSGASAETVQGTQEIERSVSSLKVLSGRLSELVGRYRT